MAIRIAHVIDHLGPGGAQTSLGSLVRHWPTAEDQLAIVSLGKRVEHSARFEQSGASVSVLGRSKWSLAAIRDLGASLRALRPDAVHAHLDKAVLASLWLQPTLRIPLVLHVRTNPQVAPLLVRWGMRRWWRRAAAVVAVSQRTAESARRHWGLPETLVHTIYNGLDTGSLSQLPPIAEARGRLGIANDRFVIGFFGRLCGDKGIDTLVEVAELLASSDSQYELLVVGDGPQRPWLERELNRRGLTELVRLAGFQEDTRPWMAAVDLGLLTSRTEGLPMACAELLAAGRPVVATDVGGTSEVVRHEETGLLAPAGDAAALAAAIRRLREDSALRSRMGEAGRKRVREQFDPEANLRRLRDLYARVAGCS